jgi:hypothetical protein
MAHSDCWNAADLWAIIVQNKITLVYDIKVLTAIFNDMLQFDSYQTSWSDTPKHCSPKTSV